MLGKSVLSGLYLLALRGWKVPGTPLGLPLRVLGNLPASELTTGRVSLVGAAEKQSPQRRKKKKALVKKGRSPRRTLSGGADKLGRAPRSGSPTVVTGVPRSRTAHLQV